MELVDSIFAGDTKSLLTPSARAPAPADDGSVDGVFALDLKKLSISPSGLSLGSGDVGSTFAHSVARGTDTTQAGLYGFAQLAGSLTGTDVLKEWGEDGVRRNMIEAARNPARIDSIDDVDSLAKLGTYVIEALGENAPNLALMAAGGGAGALAARAAVGKAALASLKKGALAGAAAVDLPVQAGESYTGLKEAGIDAPGTALLAGAAKTALDVAGVERVLSTTFKGLDKKMAADLVARVADTHGLKGVGKLMMGIGGQAARGAGVGVAVEGPTEGLQEAIDIAARAYYDPEYDITGDEAKQRIKEAIAKGAAAGGALAGAGRGTAAGANIIREYLARGTQPQEQEAAPEQTPIPEPQTTIDAQAAAVADPTSAKDTMLVTPGSPMPSEEIPGAQKVETPQGTVITTNAEKAATAPKTEAEIGALLFGDAGAEGKPADGDRIIEATDATGRPVTQIVAGPSNLEAARAEAGAQAPEGGEVRERDPREVIAERTAGLTQEERAELTALVEQAARRAPKPQAAVFEDVVEGTERQAKTVQNRGPVEPTEPIEETQEVGAEDIEAGRLSVEPGEATWTTTLKEGVDLSELQKIKTKARVLQRFIPGLQVTVDENARSVELAQALESPATRNVEEGPALYDAITKAVIEGERAQAMRTEWTHPEVLSESKTSAGKPLQLRLNTQALAYVGAALRGRSRADRATPVQVRDDLLAAFGWMVDKGFELQGYQGKKFKTKPGPRAAQPKKSGPGSYVERDAEALLPDDAVVYAPNDKTKWTWGYLTKELPRRIATLRTRLGNVETALREGRMAPEQQTRLEGVRRSLEGKLRELGAPLDEGRDENAPKETVEADEVRRYKFGKKTITHLDKAQVPADEVQGHDDRDEMGDSTLRNAETDAQQAKASVKVPSPWIKAVKALRTVKQRAEPKGASERVARLRGAVAEAKARGANPRRVVSLERRLAEAEGRAAAPSEERRGIATIQQSAPAEEGKAHGSPALQKLAGLAKEVMALVGYGELAITYADDAGLAKIEGDPRYADAVARIREEKPLARIVFPQGKTGAERVPLIYISDRVLAKDAAQQAFVLGHELGHLLQVVHFDQAAPEVQKAVRNALGPENFAENFADQVATWVVTNKAPRGVVEKFFSDLVGKLRELWQKLRSKFKLDETFSEYIDALLAAGLVRAGKEPEPPAATDFGKRVADFIAMPRGPFVPPLKQDHEYLDFGGEDVLERMAEGGKRGLQRAVGDRRAKALLEWGAQKSKAAGGVLRWGYDILIRSEVSHLQSLKIPRLDEIFTDRFHRTPGRLSRARGGTFYQRLDIEGAPLLNKMIDLAQRLFPIEPGFLEAKLSGKQADPAKVADYKQALDELRQSLPDDKLTSPIAKAVRQWMYEVYEWAQGKGLELDFAPEDFPALVDVDKLTANKDAVLQKLLDAGYSAHDAARYLEILARSHPPFHFVRRRNVLEDVPSAEEYGDRGHLPGKLVDALSEYMVDSLYDTMASYLHSMARKGVLQEMFGLAPGERGEAYVRDRFSAAGISVRDPLASLKFELQEMAATGELPVAEYERILNKTLPNFLGRQYAELSPVARRVMSVVMVWQNWAKMSLSVLSSIMDVGVIAWKSGKPLKTVELTLRGLLSKRTREQLLGDAKMLGAVRDDVVAHVLSDIGAGDAYLTKSAKRWNDRLFQWNGLQLLTSLSRAVSLSLGREAMKRFATEPDADALRALELLGTTREEVLAWMDAGEPLTGPGHKNVLAAMYQWVDESVVRPTAPIRPAWGNNPHLMLVWHLKSWMWGYTEAILKQAWNNTKAREGMAKALPFVLLGAFTLPLAALGYELRGWIVRRDKDFEPDNGFDYVKEIAQRAGVFGIFQLYVDMEEAKDYGRLALISALGPTASSVEDFFRKDLDYFFKKSLPGAAIVQGLERRVTGAEH